MQKEYETPIKTGVISANNIVWEFVDSEICLGCEQIWHEISEDNTLNEEEKDEAYCDIECFDHEKLIGDWILVDEKYEPNKNGEFAAIVTDSTFNCVQVVWSKYITDVRAMCSPCFPDQADLESGKGNIACYDLPDYLVIH